MASAFHRERRTSGSQDAQLPQHAVSGLAAIVSGDVSYNGADVFCGARLDGTCGILTGRDDSVRIVSDILG